MTSTQVMIQRQDPAIEAYRLGLLRDVQEFTRNRIAQGDLPPDYQVAGLSPAETAAISAAQQGIGGYAPFLQAGSQMVGQGQNILAQGGIPALQQALGVAGAGQQFINQASQLAAAQRALPYQYQTLASQGAQQAVGTGMGMGQQAFGQLMGGTALGQQAAARGTTALTGLAGAPAMQAGAAQQEAALAAARARQAGAAGQANILAGAGIGGAAAQQGIAALAGTGGQFSPGQISPFMNTFEDAAVQQALADVARQGQIQRQQIGAQAVGAGAFGGSRQAVAEQELSRNILEQQGRTAAQMRAAGFESAAQRAQQAFEAQQARQQQIGTLTGQLGMQAGQQRIGAGQAAGQLGLSAEQLAQTGALQGGQLGLSGIQQAGNLQNLAAQLGLSAGQQQIAAGQGIGSLASQLGNLGISGAQLQGQLGLQYGQLGQQDVAQMAELARQQAALGQGLGSLAGQYGTMAGQLGQLGIQQAGIGELQTRLGTQDIQNLLTTGATQRGVEQAILDATRLSNLQRYSQPYQQYGFLSDIYSGIPTGQSTMTASSAPQVSPFQTAIGLGIQGLSAAAGAQRAGII